VTAAKRQPPSRQRYAATHPAFAVHCDQETYARLKALRERSGLSLGRLVRQALGAVEHDIAEVEAQEAAAMERGCREGYRQARARFRLTAPCCRCGRPIEIEAGSEMATAATYALRIWGHTDCDDP
jgi:predicted DNA-binding protein